MYILCSQLEFKFLETLLVNVNIYIHILKNIYNWCIIYLYVYVIYITFVCVILYGIEECFTENTRKKLHALQWVILCNINVLFHQLRVYKKVTILLKIDENNMTSLSPHHLQDVPSVPWGGPHKAFSVQSGGWDLAAVQPMWATVTLSLVLGTCLPPAGWRVPCYSRGPVVLWNGSLHLRAELRPSPFTPPLKGTAFTA